MECKACGEEVDVGDDGLCDYCRDLFKDCQIGDDDDGEAN